MSYEVWVGIALVLNTLFGAYAIWQRHQTIRKLNGEEKFPQVHQPRTWDPSTKLNTRVIDDFFGGLDATRKSDRQDEGAGKDRPSCCK